MKQGTEKRTSQEFSAQLRFSGQVRFDPGRERSKPRRLKSFFQDSSLPNR